MQVPRRHRQPVPPWSPQPWEKGAPPSSKEEASQITHKFSPFDDPFCIFLPSLDCVAQYRREFFFSERICQSKPVRCLFWLWCSYSARPQLYNLCLTATDAWFLPFLAWKEKIFNILLFPVESGDLEAQRKDQLDVPSQYSSRCSPVPAHHQGCRAPTANQRNKAQRPPHLLSVWLVTSRPPTLQWNINK